MLAYDSLPALKRFIEAMRALHARRLEPEVLWQNARGPLEELLADPALKESSRNWPLCNHENLLFYEDPDHAFVINGLIKAPHQRTRIHDHAHLWVLYGVLEGRETIRRYARLDDGAREGYAEIAIRDEIEAGPGFVDIIEPHAIHAEFNGPDRAVAVIVRSEKPGHFLQGRFAPQENKYWQGYGVKQIPFEPV